MIPFYSLLVFLSITLQRRKSWFILIRMALYALGDLHLSFSNPDKSRDKFGKAWVNHEEKAKKNISSLVKEEDTLVLTGDHSWGRDIEEAKKDLDFILSLPGKKVLLRGNHDHFWSSNKTSKLNELYNGRLFFLQNNFAVYKDYALVGTKGFTFEGPFYVNRQTDQPGYYPLEDIIGCCEKRRLSVIHQVPSLSSDEYPSTGFSLYEGSRRISCRAGCLLSLPW